MRIYQEKQKAQLERVVCNACGKELSVENGILKEGCFHGDHAFGYFSKKDGARHRFDLCEACYDRMEAQFKIPADVEEQAEYL